MYKRSINKDLRRLNRSYFPLKLNQGSGQYKLSAKPLESSIPIKNTGRSQIVSF
jgi:hypothetical protein